MFYCTCVTYIIRLSFFICLKYIHTHLAPRIVNWFFLTSFTKLIHNCMVKPTKCLQDAGMQIAETRNYRSNKSALIFTSVIPCFCYLHPCMLQIFIYLFTIVTASAKQGINAEALGLHVQFSPLTNVSTQPTKVSQVTIWNTVHLRHHLLNCLMRPWCVLLFQYLQLHPFHLLVMCIISLTVKNARIFITYNMFWYGT